MEPADFRGAAVLAGAKLELFGCRLHLFAPREFDGCGLQPRLVFVYTCRRVRYREQECTFS
jgi:phage-related protein